MASSGAVVAPDAPAGAAGGDLTGTYPNPTLAVDRIPKSTGTTKGDLLVYNGSTWVRHAVPGNAQSLIADASAADGLAAGYAPDLMAAYTKPTGSVASSFRRIDATTNGAILATGTLNLYAIAIPNNTAITSITFVSATTALGTGTHQWFSLHDANRLMLGVTTDDVATAWAANVPKTLALGVTVSDAVTNTDTSLTSATAVFVQGTDAGKAITGAGIAAGTTISSVTNATTVVLSQATTATASGVTVTFARPVTYTTTSAGLYYCGILVTAATPPSLAIHNSIGGINGIAPIISGNSDTGKTTPPPTTSAFTAAALTATGSIPYFYLS